MKATVVFLTTFVSYVLVRHARAQRSAQWDGCECRWADWGDWSHCTRKCWGIQIRKRQVWKKNTPECTGFEVCDAGSGAADLNRCNQQCTAGSYSRTDRRCVCPAGLYGECCDQVCTCGKAPAVINANVPNTTYNFGDVFHVQCSNGYRLEGKPELVCGVSGWNGSLPECVAVDPCERATCFSGEVCQPQGKSYMCFCPKNAPCNPNLAPELANCPDSKNITTPDRIVVYRWDEPKFKDAAGEKLVIESNYPNSYFRFPWGHHTIQYTAVKKSNGQRASCQFSVDIKPMPCTKLSAPNKGYLVCSDWRRDYDTFCMVGCTANYDMAADFDPQQWIVCGSSGIWTPAKIPNECNVMFGGNGGTAHEDALLTVDECLSDETKATLQRQFLQIFRKSPFRAFCDNYADICMADNVVVNCWDNDFDFF